MSESAMSQLSRRPRRIRPDEALPPPPTLWDQFIPEAPSESKLFKQLVAIGVEMLHAAGRRGVTVGEVCEEAENRGIDTSSPPLADKQKEQRQNSHFARVLPAANGVPTGERRESPLKRHHRKPQRVYVSREIERDG